ncbi:MlaD family protein [Williamsia deligens]|uniref:MlaD family protein n=1 Tax=Williamsia deligens TaxID=321325 RepID=A0ABW3GAF8_9NOCA|nr:MlaD family protein [Williamsia deligens]MCP2192601.1 phospholipid/cholesterol/gamma-HCH transport system substrate-binding protein [Williamsia deligens]
MSAPTTQRDARPARTPDRRRRREVVVGLVGVAVLAVIALVCGLLYVMPPGEREYTADFASSGQLRPGDEVRVAGIRVGEVRDARVVGDHVEIRFGMDDSVRLGDRTGADIRLTTAIGGHYLAITPQGSQALRGHIPRSATSTPYELTDVIADSGAVVEKVDAVTTRQTFAQVSQALAGRSDAAREIIGQIAAVTTTLGDRDDDLDRAIAITEEYIGALNNGRAQLVNVLRLVGLIGYRFYQFRFDALETIRGVDALFAFLEPPVSALSGTIDPEVDKVKKIVLSLRDRLAGSNPIINRLSELANEIGGILSTDGSTVDVDLAKTTVDAPALCIPVPGRGC